MFSCYELHRSQSQGFYTCGNNRTDDTDDTGIILDGTEKSLESALHLLEQYAKYSGLTPNLDKTSCVWLGSKISSQEILLPERHLNWTDEPFTVLGIKFSTNLAEMPDINFEHKIAEIKKLIASWSRRQISVPGRITVVKTILLSKLTHLFISLPRLNQASLKDLERTLFNYIWDKKRDRVARCQLIQDYSLGGLRMVHLQSFIESMKLSWIQRLLTTGAPWVNLYNCILPGKLELLLCLPLR